MRIVKAYTRAIWADGWHNAFPGITRFGEHYYVAFRHSEGHQAPHGTIWVIRAKANDLDHWEKVAEFDLGGDSRDPFICVVRDHLHVYWHRGEDYVSRSSNGLTWSEPRELDTEFPQPPPDCKLEFTSRRKWLFRIRRGPDGFYYSLGRCGIASNGNPGILLYRSEDGLTWKAMHTFGEGIQKVVNAGHEADLAFLEDGGVVAAIRISGVPRGGTGMIACARPPYLEWDAYWTGVPNFGGPALWKTPYGILLAARDNPVTGCMQCTIWQVTPSGLMNPWRLPSGGDCAYQTFEDGPEGEILLCYYSSHEWPQQPMGANPANIYLARITIRPGMPVSF